MGCPPSLQHELLLASPDIVVARLDKVGQKVTNLGVSLIQTPSSFSSMYAQFAVSSLNWLRPINTQSNQKKIQSNLQYSHHRSLTLQMMHQIHLHLVQKSNQPIFLGGEQNLSHQR